MKRDGHNNVKFFIGPEVEMTPAHGKKTLFVVGEQPVEEIVKHARENGSTHVFLGANHSFNDQAVVESWSDMISSLLAANFTVTLDYSVEHHGFLLDSLSKDIWKSRNFVPLVSVRIPHIEESGPNLTVKIDDVDFAATNPGVWCMHYSELTDSNRFTGWVDYESDRVIGEDSLPEAAIETVEPVVNSVTLVVEESVTLNVNDIGLDTTGTTAMEQKSEETAEDSVKAEAPVETEVSVETEVEAPAEETVAATEAKETKKKQVRKND